MKRLLTLLVAVPAAAMPLAANFTADAALPQIEQALGPGSLDINLVVTVYLVVFAALMLVGGAFGDRFGRKRWLLWGIAIFTLSSAACGLSQTTEQLIAARAAQGLGAALLLPATLSNLAATFRERGRGAALGLWAAVTAVAAAFSPLAGAWLIEQHSWEWLFFINVPVGVAALILATAIRESRDPALLRRFDLAGVFTGSVGIGFLSYALVEGTRRGWSEREIAGSFALAALFLLLFLVIETRRRQPMVSVRFAGHGTFSGSNAVAAATFFAIFGVGTLLSAYLRTIAGYPTELTVRRLVPFAAILILASPIAGQLSDRIGSRGLMASGCLIAAGGLGMLLQAEVTPDYEGVVLPALVLLGVGMSLVIGPMTTAVTAVAEPGQVGGASGATGTARQLGLLLGVGLLGTVVTTAFANSLLTRLLEAGVEGSAAQAIVDRAPVRDLGLGGPFEALRTQMPPGTASGVLDGAVRAAQDSFVGGVRIGMLLSIGFLLLAALISMIFVRTHVVSLFRVEAPPRQAEGSRKEQVLMQEPPVETDTAVPPDATPAPDPDKSQTGSDQPGPAPVAEPTPAELPQDTTTILFQFPFKAGSGTVVQNITEFLRGTSSLYEDASYSSRQTELPEPIAVRVKARATVDVATLAGYLLLEQRFGRLNSGIRPELAATALIGAARSMQLWRFSEKTEPGADDFLHQLITVVMDGIGPAPDTGAAEVAPEAAPLSA